MRSAPTTGPIPRVLGQTPDLIFGQPGGQHARIAPAERVVRPGGPLVLHDPYDSYSSYSSYDFGRARDLTAEAGRRPEPHGHIDSAARADRAVAREAGAGRLG